MFVAAQIAGGFAIAVLLAYSIVKVTSRTILFCNIVINLLWAVHYLLLGAYTGCACSLLFTLIGVVLGVPLTIFGGIGAFTINYLDLIVMLLSAIMLFLFSFKTHKLDKKAGITFLIVFVLYYSFVIIGK